MPKIARQKKNEIFTPYSSMDKHRHVFSLLHLVHSQHHWKVILPVKTKASKTIFKKIILSLIFFKDYYNLCGKYTKEILKFGEQKKSELELIFIPREALKKNNRLLVKKLKFKNPYQIPFTGDPSPKALPAAMKKYSTQEN